MVETYYICFDNKAMTYAKKHFSNQFAKVYRCFTNSDADRVIRFMNANKGKTYCTLRSTERGFLCSEVKSIEILSSLVVGVAKRIRLSKH